MMQRYIAAGLFGIAVALAALLWAAAPFSSLMAQQDPAAPAAPAPPPERDAREPLPPPAFPTHEAVEADVSTRSVAVTSSFSGTEILVFGSVDNSRQPNADAGYYDVVVVVEGVRLPLVARRKGKVAGIWVNADSLRFASLPSYYAIASTRPLSEIAEPDVMAKHGIGFDQIEMKPSKKLPSAPPPADLNDFKSAIIRLKQKQGLYVTKDTGVLFIGRSLFRSWIGLPANIPVGELNAKVYLFRKGQVISEQTTRFGLQRQGLELFLHDFARQSPLLYGIVAVLLALASGMITSTLFSRGFRR
jgi:uncharacterized protein (TIGR02186 family)